MPCLPWPSSRVARAGREASGSGNGPRSLAWMGLLCSNGVEATQPQGVSYPAGGHSNGLRIGACIIIVPDNWTVVSDNFLATWPSRHLPLLSRAVVHSADTSSLQNI